MRCSRAVEVLACLDGVFDLAVRDRPCPLRLIKHALYSDTPGCERKSFTQAIDEASA